MDRDEKYETLRAEVEDLKTRLEAEHGQTEKLMKMMLMSMENFMALVKVTKELTLTSKEMVDGTKGSILDLTRLIREDVIKNFSVELGAQAIRIANLENSKN